MVIYFDPYELAPGETREYSTILGLSGDEEYGEEAVEIIQIEEEPVVIEEVIEEEPEQIELKETVDLDVFNEELERIKRIRELISEENKIMEEINRILEIEDNVLKEEELNRLKEALAAIEEKRKSGEQ